MHLNVFLSKSGFCSRRKAASLIKEGKAQVAGKVILEPWFEVGDKDSVKIDGKLLKLEKNTYVIFNKPQGVTTTLKDKFARKKITDFIPDKFGRLYPVGRLDKESRGLIILTNDGKLCYELTHPKFEIEKEYILWVKGKIDTAVLEKLKKGMKDKGDILKVKTAAIEVSESNKTRIRVVVAEGKKRHLRRLLRCAGFPVVDLKRIRIGKLKLGNLKEGSFKILEKRPEKI